MPSLPALPRAALAFVAVSLFFDSLTQSMTFPLLPRLAGELLDGDAVAAARWVGWLEVGWALPMFFAAPVLGALSDRFGRRPVIVISTLGLAAELVLSALAPTIWWLLLGRVLVGISYGAQAAAMAYVADVTEPEQRTAAYGWTSAAVWSGILIGPAFGGVLAELGLRTPFWVAAALVLVAGAYALVFLPESLPRERRAPFRIENTSPLSALDFLFRRPEVRLLAVVLVITWLVLQASDNLEVLYTAHRYGWTPLTFGLWVAVIAGAGLLVSALLAARLSARFGDRRTLAIGLGLQALGLLGMGLAPTSTLFWLACVPTVLGGVARPALQSLLSRAAGPEEQGRLQGAITSVASLTSIAAPLVFTQLFAWSIAPAHPLAWSGVTLLAAAALTTLALILSLRVLPSSPGRGSTHGAVKGARVPPPRAGEGDHAKHGGGGKRA